MMVREKIYTTDLELLTISLCFFYLARQFIQLLQFYTAVYYDQACLTVLTGDGFKMVVMTFMN